MHKMLTYPGATPVEDSFSLMSSHGSVVMGGEEMKDFQLMKCVGGFHDALTPL